MGRRAGENLPPPRSAFWRGLPPENGEEVRCRGNGSLAENGFEEGGIAALVQGGSQILADRKASAQQDRDDRLAQTLHFSLHAALSLALGTDLVQAGVALALEEVAEDHLA